MAILRSMTLFIALRLAGGMAANTTAVTSTSTTTTDFTTLAPTTTPTTATCWDVYDEVVDTSSGGSKIIPGTYMGRDFVVEVEFNTVGTTSGWSGLFGFWKRKPNTASGVYDAYDLRQLVCWQKPSEYTLACYVNAYPDSEGETKNIAYSQGEHTLKVAIVGGTGVTVYLDGAEQLSFTLNDDGFVNGVDDVFAVIGSDFWTSYPGTVSRFAMTNMNSVCPIATTSSQTSVTTTATSATTSTQTATTTATATSATSTNSATTSSESTSVTSATTTVTSATSLTATTSSMTATTTVTEGDSGWWWVNKGFSIELSWHCSILILMATLAHIRSD